MEGLSAHPACPGTRQGGIYGEELPGVDNNRPHAFWLTPTQGGLASGECPECALWPRSHFKALSFLAATLPHARQKEGPSASEADACGVRGCSLQDGSSRGWACRARESLYL